MPPTETLPVSAEVDVLRHRVDELEAGLAALRNQLQTRRPEAPATGRPWWEERAGAFADDPGFEEMANLGQQWRQAERHDDAEETST